VGASAGTRRISRPPAGSRSPRRRDSTPGRQRPTARVLRLIDRGRRPIRIGYLRIGFDLIEPVWRIRSDGLCGSSCRLRTDDFTYRGSNFRTRSSERSGGGSCRRWWSAEAPATESPTHDDGQHPRPIRSTATDHHLVPDPSVRSARWLAGAESLRINESRRSSVHPRSTWHHQSRRRGRYVSGTLMTAIARRFAPRSFRRDGQSPHRAARRTGERRRESARGHAHHLACPQPR